MTNTELFATCWTTAGDTSPLEPDQRSPVDFRTRVEAASAAGFSGAGFLYVDLLEAEQTYGLNGMRAILADNGITRWETELLTDWWPDAPTRKVSDEQRTGMLRLIEALAGHDLKIGPDESGNPWDRERWAEEFARLAGQTADVGARLAIEFLPWSNLPTIGDGLALVEAAGHPAGGLIIDNWHIERAGTSHDEVAACPVERIVGVELSDADATVVGTFVEDTVFNRRLCGQGDFDLRGLIAALRQAGWTGPWGVEILSSTYRKLPVAEAARQAYESAKAILDS
ncbi:Sugar phosphate isomerase/epimerase [Raineyella antarctica]|uniref:Sugar phosphate isomerase/epimerase n=1 Tax=Raineyella antarctica TaxID=1577474 RepID=A0A1G6GEZ7_9ACTN|nr:TIM barrel protein [Raineyella antarctica]SDB80557.1 Sugar phosphate isomerase/epimerase [Raineyella antarctica]